MIRQIVRPGRQTDARLESVAMNDAPVADLLARAADGDHAAWNALVEKYSRLVWFVVRGFRLDDAAAADVTQTVWLRLVEHCDRIRHPERLPGWLAATARNEALRVLKQQRSLTPTESMSDLADRTTMELDETLVDNEMQRAVLRAFIRLPDDAQQLLRLLITEPPLDYATISDLIGRPIGSIGPTRQRILSRLRALMEAELGDEPGGKHT